MDVTDDYGYTGVFIINNAYISSISSVIVPYAMQKYIEFGTTTRRIILPQDINARIAGQCVGWVKYVTGKDYSGNALEWTEYINSTTPKIGSIVVIKAGRWGHIGVVIDIEKDSIIVRSRNWEGLWIVSDDVFNIDDIRILGYIK